MEETKTIITKAHGSFSCRIDHELQKCNPLTARGIYLVEVENGVVWGYDSEKYEINTSNDVVRKTQDDDSSNYV